MEKKAIDSSRVFILSFILFSFILYSLLFVTFVSEILLRFRLSQIDDSPLIYTHVRTIVNRRLATSIQTMSTNQAFSSLSYVLG